MATDLFDRFPVIDVDTHLTEPPDVWTARMPAKVHDKVPHIERIDGRDVWMADGQRIGAPGYYSMAGHDGVMPLSVPNTFDDIAPEMYDANARVAFLDREGIQAEVLYPNVGGFGNGYFLNLGDREFVMDCVRAYNDFLTDWCSVAPDRLLPITALPFWDVDQAITEMQRNLANGHRAVNFCNQPDAYGQPPLAHKHWDPVWAAAQEAGIPISFHVGGGLMGTQFDDRADMGWMTNFAKTSSFIFMDNMRSIGDLIFGGVCHRFPDLKFVSVESGVGWIPSALETFDWQWRNGGVVDEHPEYDLLPSEYFRRQIYGCFWFEEQTALDAIAKYPDNILFESDYPHPTCQHPGPRTPAQRPRDYASRTLASLSDDVTRKVLHDNAAALYGVA
ncbi:MAG: amidohydrolase family protein [Acidimicrobiia bacterium]